MYFKYTNSNLKCAEILLCKFLKKKVDGPWLYCIIFLNREGLLISFNIPFDPYSNFFI